MNEFIKSLLKSIKEYFQAVWVKLIAQLIIFLTIVVMYITTTRLLPKRLRVQKYRFKQFIERIEEFSDYTPSEGDSVIQLATKSNGMFNRILDTIHDNIEDPHWDFKAFVKDKKPEFNVYENEEFTSSYLPTVAPFASSMKKIGSLNKNEHLIEYLFQVGDKKIELIVISNQENIVNHVSDGKVNKATVSKGSFEEVFAAKNEDYYQIINVLFDKVSNKLHLTADNNGSLQISPVDQGYDQNEYVPDETFLSGIERQIRRTAFFPGGHGMWNPEAKPTKFPFGGLMILGHDFHSQVEYQKSLERGEEDLNGPTWRNLIDVLTRADIDLKNCFFTNAYMGLRGGHETTGKFPGAL
ncbi:MAG: hypothetical protein EBU90_26005, partial [Proteobacteria bacterium]|nr:hypothetical protein [Pseudomonadota bacterium]